MPLLGTISLGKLVFDISCGTVGGRGHSCYCNIIVFLGSTAGRHQGHLEFLVDEVCRRGGGLSCTCMPEHIDTYNVIYIYEYTHIHMCIICKPTYVYTYIYIYIYIYVYTYVGLHIIHICICVYSYMYITLYVSICSGMQVQLKPPPLRHTSSTKNSR